MRICPVDLHRCDRLACGGGTCRECHEAVLTPCLECGTLVLLRGVAICVGCLEVEQLQAEHH